MKKTAGKSGRPWVSGLQEEACGGASPQSPSPAASSSSPSSLSSEDISSPSEGVLADYTKDCSRFTLTLSKTNARRYNSHKSGGEKGDPRVQRCRGRRCGSPSRQEPARLEGRPGTPRSHPACPRSVSTGPLSGLLRPDSPRRHSTTREDAPINNGQGRSEGCRGTASQSSVPGVGVAPEAGRPGASELPPPFSSPRVANK